MTCFYCGASIDPRAKMSDNNRATKDHVYPSSLVNSLAKDVRAKLSDEFWHLNRVDCCTRCNSYKGQLHPLDWLVIMPNAHAAKRLAERMVKMGEDMGEVFDALHRRRK